MTMARAIQAAAVQLPDRADRGRWALGPDEDAFTLGELRPALAESDIVVVDEQ